MNERHHTSGETKMARYIDTKDVAKLVRKELKVFKGTKFSVRIDRFAGGSSIDVGWTDGPTDKEVREVAGHFVGSTFNGMDDSTSYHNCFLPDGEEVHFNNRFLSFNRAISIDLFRELQSYIAQKWGPDVWKFEVFESNYGNGVPTGGFSGSDSHGKLSVMDMHRLMGDEIRRTSAWPIAQLIDDSRF